MKLIVYSKIRLGSLLPGLHIQVSQSAFPAANMQTCTGCRKQKASEEFQRYNRNNLTCNACSERHRMRKNKEKAAAKAAGQQAAEAVRAAAKQE